jgi:hypothetical protein
MLIGAFATIFAPLIITRYFVQNKGDWLERTLPNSKLLPVDLKEECGLE